jgi:outer membrane immunogenic protein
MLRWTAAGLLPFAALLTTGGAAFAADPMATPVVNWQGVYIGAQGGYGFGTAAAKNGASLDPALELSPTGWVGGGQIGVNWQFQNNSVVGVEANFDATGMSATGATSFNPGTGIVDASEIQKVDSLGAFRARFGYSAGQVMPYIVGGVAFGIGSRTVTQTSGLPCCTGSASKTYTGWTAGAGAEIALDSHWSIRGEYSYVDLGTQNFVVPGPGGGTDVHLTANLVTGALNYRW